MVCPINVPLQNPTFVEGSFTLEKQHSVAYPRLDPPSSSPGYLKADAGKLRPSLLPQPALDSVLAVLEAGASVHGEWGWHSGISYTRLLDAAERHLAALRRGEARSDHKMPSGSYGFHVAHAICELLFLLEFQIEGREDLNDLKVLQAKEPI